MQQQVPFLAQAANPGDIWESIVIVRRLEMHTVTKSELEIARHRAHTVVVGIQLLVLWHLVVRV
jgi:hypothetical protein